MTGERRQSYNEDDIWALIASPRLLIAADAYGADRGTLSDMVTLAFIGPLYVPRSLDPIAFAGLVFEVVRRIHMGEINVPSEWRREHAEFYTIEHPKPEL